MPYCYYGHIICFVVAFFNVKYAVCRCQIRNWEIFRNHWNLAALKKSILIVILSAQSNVPKLMMFQFQTIPQDHYKTKGMPNAVGTSCRCEALSLGGGRSLLMH